MRSYGAAVLRSGDLGETWTSLAGEPVATPTLYRPDIAIPPAGDDIFVRSIACAPDGCLWALTMPRQAAAAAPLWLSRREKYGWYTLDISPLLPSGLVALDGIMTWDTGARLHLALTLAPAPAAGIALDWGEKAGEVFHLCLDSRVQVLACSQISPTDPQTPNWLPMISRNGPFQPVRNPVILYTHGAGGKGCRPADNTEVWCVPVFTND